MAPVSSPTDQRLAHRYAHVVTIERWTKAPVRPAIRPFPVGKSRGDSRSQSERLAGGGPAKLKFCASWPAIGRDSGPASQNFERSDTVPRVQYQISCKNIELHE